MIAAIITAAGSGLRLGPGDPKAQRMVRGLPLFVYSLRTLCANQLIDHIVVVVRSDAVDEVKDFIAHDPIAGPSSTEVNVVAGGATRQESVALGLASMDAGVDHVLVHDAARALVPAEVVEAVIARLMDGALAVVPVIEVTDTIRSQVDASLGVVVDRNSLRSVQTPQGFTREVLVRAHQSVGVAATDDASLVEALGVQVVGVNGSPEAFKITYPTDLIFAEALIDQQEAGSR